MKLTSLYRAVSMMRCVKFKFLMVMKLTSILLLIGTLHVTAASFSQTVTISRKNTSLETVFKDIKRQTGFLFFYTEKVNTTKNNISVELNNASIDQAITACLAGQDLLYDIVNKTIVIRKKISTKPVEAISDKIEINGKVVDSEQGGIPGVNITVKNNKNLRAQTNSKGEFKITIEAGDVLVFSYIGFAPKEVVVRDSKYLTVSLEVQSNDMKAVVVTGYQTINKETYTGNAIVITGTDLKKNNPQSLLKAIQTFDPSFKLMDNNLIGSDPNKLPKINVRGATALPSMTDDVLDRNNLSSAYNTPAFILDGFEVTLQKVVDMDLNRIETVTLLKDGAATAVYGSRAANGVIVITTKAPVAGKLQLSYNYELNFTAPDLSDYHVLNAKDKVAYEQLAGLYKASTLTSGNTKQEQLDAELFSRLKNVASGVNTYWLSQPLKNALSHKHSLYAQGGDQTFRYGIDLRYQTQDGVMIGSGNKRYSGGINFTYNPTPKLIFRNEITVTQVDQVNSPYGNFASYVYANPYYPIKDASGNLVQELASWSINTQALGADQYQTQNQFNPLYEASLNSFDKNANTEIIDAFSVDYKLSGSFRLKGLVSLNKSNYNSDVFVSPYSSAFYNTAAADLNNRGSYDYRTEDRLGIDGNVTLNYNKQLGDHFFNLVLGANVLSSESDAKLIQAQGFSNDRFTNIGFARIYKNEGHPDGSVIKSRTAGAFFSGNYSFRNKYLMDASFRMDGSSAFGADKRFAPFWSVGLGWNMHKEEFLANSSFISQLRLKGSIATLGSISFPAYQARSIYNYDTANWYSTGLGATVAGYGNTNLQWQKTKTTDAGLDIGILKDRIVISPRYYYKLTKGLITDINLSPSTGFTTYKDNLGDMSNKGYELYLQANVFRTKDWNINLTGNLAHNVNKIVKISNSLKGFNENIDNFQTNTGNNAYSTPLLRYVEGQSLYTIYGVKSMGIDPENGKELFMKKDGSLTYKWDVKDVQAIGESTPKAEGSIGSNITYKRFMMSFNFHYRYGGQTYNQTLIDRVENADPRFNVDSRVLTERWVKPGDQTFFKNIADLNKTYVSSRFVQKDNLIELQSLYFSYDFKPEMVRRAGFQNLRTALTMNDLLRSSSIDIERGINYPFARSLTFSVQASF